MSDASADDPAPAPPPGPDVAKLTEAMLAGLAGADEDAADAEYLRQLSSITDEDYMIPRDPDAPRAMSDARPFDLDDDDEDEDDSDLDDDEDD